MASGHGQPERTIRLIKLQRPGLETSRFRGTRYVKAILALLKGRHAEHHGDGAAHGRGIGQVDLFDNVPQYEERKGIQAGTAGPGELECFSRL
jgi:hypothetical protein